MCCPSYARCVPNGCMKLPTQTTYGYKPYGHQGGGLGHQLIFLFILSMVICCLCFLCSHAGGGGSAPAMVGMPAYAGAAPYGMSPPGYGGYGGYMGGGGGGGGVGTGALAGVGLAGALGGFGLGALMGSNWGHQQELQPVQYVETGPTFFPADGGPGSGGGQGFMVADGGGGGMQVY